MEYRNRCISHLSFLGRCHKWENKASVGSQDLTPRPSVIKWSASCVLFPHRISFLLVTQNHFYFRQCGIHCDSTSESDQRLFMAAVDPDGPNIDARHAQSLIINITYNTGESRASCIVWFFIHSFFGIILSVPTTSSEYGFCTCIVRHEC
jgi:hypothetical protein